MLYQIYVPKASYYTTEEDAKQYLTMYNTMNTFSKILDINKTILNIEYIYQYYPHFLTFFFNKEDNSMHFKSLNNKRFNKREKMIIEEILSSNNTLYLSYFFDSDIVYREQRFDIYHSIIDNEIPNTEPIKSACHRGIDNILYNRQNHDYICLFGNRIPVFSLTEKEQDNSLFYFIDNFYDFEIYMLKLEIIKYEKLFENKKPDALFFGYNLYVPLYYRKEGRLYDITNETIIKETPKIKKSLNNLIMISEKERNYNDLLINLYDFDTTKFVSELNAEREQYFFNNLIEQQEKNNRIERL